MSPKSYKRITPPKEMIEEIESIIDNRELWAEDRGCERVFDYADWYLFG